MDSHYLSGNHSTDVQTLNKHLRTGESFDVIGRSLVIGGRQAVLYFIDGLAKDEVMEKILEYFLSIQPEEMDARPDAVSFSRFFVPYIEVAQERELDKILTSILSGTLALLIEGYGDAILIDARTYPTRGVEEPDDDRALRGSRDGFVETLVHNTALVRRRIRDPQLTMEILQVGSRSKTDIVLCYMAQLVDKSYLEKIRGQIQNITIPTLTMSQESLAECLVKRQWYNPFPRVRYTERPDAAAANLAEGKIVVIVDNSPSVMILPTSFFDFTQDTNDFYFPPFVGSYLRIVRTVIFLLTLFLTPVWYLLIQNPAYIPGWLEFIRIEDPITLPVIFQLLVIEFVIDGLKLASLNTPSVLSNSFSVVGALILGEFAVSAKWFVPEVVLYMAFVAIANFAQPSFELGYAFKLSRVMLLILTALFSLWGFVAGLVLLAVLIASTKTIGGKSYLFPLIPFNKSAFVSLFIRKPINRNNS